MKSTKIQQPLTQEEYEELVRKYTSSTDEDISSSLKVFHLLLYDAFLDAQVKTNEVIKSSNNQKIIKWFYPEAIRFYVLDFLSQEGIEARLVNDTDDEQTDELEWDSDILPGNGIAGTVEGFEYRILKMFKGGLPPARSDKRKRFYSQSHLKSYSPPLPLFSKHVPENKFTVKPHIIYLWEIIKSRLSLYFAIPRHYTLYASTKCIYIPNPITEIGPVSEERVEEGVPVERQS
jgi:hypothetical protein